MAEIEIHLRAEQRRWVPAGLKALAYGCFALSLVSTRLANIVADFGVDRIASLGFRYIAERR